MKNLSIRMIYFSRDKYFSKINPPINLQVGVLEMTWVVNDYTAANAHELSVLKGQQVEVVEVCSSKPDYCLVRMPTKGTDYDSAHVPEGLVPLSVLKQPPPPKSSPSRRVNLDRDGNHLIPSSNNPFLSLNS